MQSKIKQIINGKRYNTETATVIADNEYWDGSNHERCGRNTHLYRTDNGAYFAGHSTQWEGERDYIEVLSEDEALALYEQLNARDAMPFEEAFPGRKLEEA